MRDIDIMEVGWQHSQAIHEDCGLLRVQARSSKENTMPFRNPFKKAHGSGVERFSEDARKVLTRAQEAAKHLEHGYIGVEHILFGIVDEETGVAANVLTNLGAPLANVRAAVEFVVVKGERQGAGEISLAPHAKCALQVAVDEARRLNSSYIGSEHLLLGLLGGQAGVAFSVLESFGITHDRVCEELAHHEEHQEAEAEIQPPQLDRAGWVSSRPSSIPTKDDIEMSIDSIRVSLQNYQRVIIMKERYSNRYLPIWIGPAEADTIAVKLQGVETARPLTHDAMLSLITALNATLDHAVVNELKKETFYARLCLQCGGQVINLDVRPSDAIALAVRADCPIYATQSVLEKAGITLDEDGELVMKSADTPEGFTLSDADCGSSELEGLWNNLMAQ